MIKSPSLIALVFALLGFCSQNGITQDSAAPDHELKFNRDIRPILSSACYRCHGFDEKTREADLRLDQADSAFAKRNDRFAIVPGKVDESLVWDRIHSNDPDKVMPPPSSKRQLTDDEKKLIGNWIQQGAKYEKHWSFEPISTPRDTEKSVDRYLNDELNRKGLTPQPTADPVTLVRRLSFVLTGLPPSQSDVDSYASDPSEANYLKLVNHYLDSRHFGEEMAKHWLDVARYGDTHGLHLDNERQMWAYRDWVVDAFNANLPFNQFTIEQLAGDLLPNPTQAQLVATGFNRCNVTTSEGGAINDEFLFRYAVDRTSTTIQAWMGLTAGCAVCHDHKYDPISMKEFYSLYSFFYSAADPAMDGNINRTEPFLKLPNSEQSAALEKAKQLESAAQEDLVRIASNQESIDFEKQNDKRPSSKGLFTAIWLNDDIPLGSQRNSARNNTTRNDPTWIEEPNVPMGKRALRQSFGNKYEQTITGGMYPLWIPEQATLKAWVRIDLLEPPKAIFIDVKSESVSKRWVWCDDPEDAKLVDSKADRVVGPLPQRGKWTELSVPMEGMTAGKRVTEFKLGLFKGVCYWDGVVCTGMQREQDKWTSDFRTWWASVKGTNVAIAEGEVAKAISDGPDKESSKAHEGEVEQFFRTYISDVAAPSILDARQRWQAAKNHRAMIESQIPGTFVFKDETKARQAHVMKRGQYDQKGEPVSPNTPAVFPKIVSRREGQAINRLDLAEWLVSNENPLVARVAVNRFWQQVFGTGLVKSSDDFGAQGMPPSHPELLDHLAHRFRSGGWNIKGLMRDLVVTDAFRRSARVTTDDFNIDPENRYLARGPRMRLDAEQIRDNVLAVSGLLNPRKGGPGVRGYQPQNIWEPVGYGDSNTRYYVQDHGPDLYCRSLYCFIKRTAPPPFMSNFDAPNREMFCTRRERSNTPLQALQLMNDVQHVEAARVLAEKILKNTSVRPEDRIAATFMAVLSRKPTTAEHGILAKAMTQFQSRFEANEEDAKRLLAIGEKPYDSRLPLKDVAAMTLFSNLVLNLDETVNRN